MDEIDTDELKAKIDRGDIFKLVMTMGDWAFAQKHIPGSINVSSPDDAADRLMPDDEIVVYCTGGSCVASSAAFRALKDRGYSNLRHYPGGLEAWEDAGHPVEGRLAPAD